VYTPAALTDEFFENRFSFGMRTCVKRQYPMLMDVGLSFGPISPTSIPGMHEPSDVRSCTCTRPARPARLVKYHESPSESTLHCAGRERNGTHHEAMKAVVDSFDDQVGEDERMGARVHAWHVPSAGVGV
jgi:hypothetical protein